MRPATRLAVCAIAVLVPAIAAADEAREAFAAVRDSYLGGLAAHYPVYGTTLGDHRFDDRLDDVSAAGRSAQRAWLAEHQQRLDAIDLADLPVAERTDAELLAHELSSGLWQIDELQAWAWDPLYYNALAGGALYSLMAREFAPLPERLAAATARLEALPQFFVAARAALRPERVPAIHAETALAQHRGVIGIVDALIEPSIGTLDADAAERLRRAIDTARGAATEHEAWLRDQLVPNAAGDFRLGRERYNTKLKYTLNADMTAPAVRRLAEQEYQRVRTEMYDVARDIYAGRYPQSLFPDAPTDAYKQAIIRAALEVAYADSPPRDGVVTAARESLQTTTDFVRAKNLVRIPDAPLEIILMPEFQRGISLAYCDSPGALDKGLATYYAVSPIPDDWTDAQTDGYLREYNYRSIHNLTVHEAMPGHYLQLAHANEYPSVLRAVLQSGTFIEGWAVYTEHVMVDAGYYDDDPLMRLIQLKWYLRAVINAILDQAVHVDGLDRESAMQLLIEGGFQEEREAAGKWIRAQLTSAQLSTYFVGYQQHAALRQEIESLDGDNFNLRAYHDAVLSYGSPPVRYVRNRLLAQRQASASTN
ncbi:MAG: DUF885 domain-containing protein [Pseudomonadota bacterium]